MQQMCHQHLQQGRGGSNRQVPLEGILPGQEQSACTRQQAAREVTAQTRPDRRPRTPTLAFSGPEQAPFFGAAGGDTPFPPGRASLDEVRGQLHRRRREQLFLDLASLFWDGQKEDTGMRHIIPGRPSPQPTWVAAWRTTNRGPELRRPQPLFRCKTFL